MSEEYDFSELRNYLNGQMDLGEAELLLDEPWTLTRKARPAAGTRPAAPIPPKQTMPQAAPTRTVYSNPPPAFPNARAQAPQGNTALSSDDGLTIPGAPIPDNTGSTGSFFGDIPRKSDVDSVTMVAPAPRSVKKVAAAYESVQSIDAFYNVIKAEVMYTKEPQVLRYAGPAKPKLLFVLPAAKPNETADTFLANPVGEMLVRLFANLGYTQEDIGVTYYYKSIEKPLAPLLDMALKKMLAKEVKFIAPEIIVPFSKALFHKMMGKNLNYDDLAGTAMEFEGFKTVCLIDPYAMVNDKQMKWLTWKIHIPRSGLFKVKA